MEPLDDITIKKASAYAVRYELRLGERLGFEHTMPIRLRANTASGILCHVDTSQDDHNLW
jgi:hypothetical protein